MKKIDRSKFVPSPDRDHGFQQGKLQDGRPYRIEYWFENGAEIITIFIPFEAVGPPPSEELFKALMAEKILTFDFLKYKEEFGEAAFSTSKIVEDDSGEKLWEITLLAAMDENTYVAPLRQIQKYQFPSEGTPKEDTPFYFAFVKDGIFYNSYFINNSPHHVFHLTENGKLHYENIGPYSALKLNGQYESWWFDWFNDIDMEVILKNETYNITYSIEKYAVAWAHKKETVPILNQEGWLYK